MDESSNSSLGSSSGTPPTGNGVPGSGGDSGFHPQQMHQQFGAAYRPGKFQAPLGLHQQRPVMISYDQHSAPQQQGSYMHHGPYQQLLHQQQQLQFQQQQQQQQQQLHQQLQMQFPQQPENLQRSMPYTQDAQKSSSSQNQAQNLKSSDAGGTSNKGNSSIPSTVTIKPDSSTDDGAAKETSQTPAEVEKLTKELESQRTAHEKQVKDLEALIASLQDQKKEKEVKYLRVGSGGSSGTPQKKKLEQEEIFETSPKRKCTRSKSALNNDGDEDMDTGADAGVIMDSCPSPTPSNVSIKEEPDDDDEFEKWAIQGIKFPRVLDEDGDTKANLKKEIGKSDPENNHPKPYILSVTDFDLCIFCQTKSEIKMVDVTEERLEIVQSMVLNVDCEASNRLKEYILDVDLFINNLPQYHSPCHRKMKQKLENGRKKRKNAEETDFSLCILCQEHRNKSTFSFTNKGFTSFMRDLENLDPEIIENLNVFFNFDRIKNVVLEESAKEEFYLDKFKIHGWCRKEFTRKNKPRKRVNTSISEQENMEGNVEITPDEETFELLAKRKQFNEEKIKKKQRKELPEPNEFDYKKRCVICGQQVKGLGRDSKVKSIKELGYKKIYEYADKMKEFDIIKILEYGEKKSIHLTCHSKCYSKYSTSRYPKQGIGKYEYFEIAFQDLIAEIEEPMFRYGKVYDLAELRNKYLEILKKFDIESDMKVGIFSKRIQDYYTFHKKDCRVKALIFPDNFLYSNHLSESQVAPQISEIKKMRKTVDAVDTNKDSTEVPDSNSEIKNKWKFSCTECGFKCVQTRTYEKHLKKHQLKSIEEIIEVMCDICGKLLKSKLSLKAHLKTHDPNHVEEKYPCSQCDKSYLSKTALYSHELTHSQKDAECLECGKMFYGKYHLSKHRKRVHGTGQVFLCSICGKSFKTSERLKTHVVKHSDDKPFVCKECGKAFKYRSNLNTHVMAHEGRKPFMCKICSYGCYTNANLKLHMDKHTEKNEQFISSKNDMENEKYAQEKYVLPHEEIPNFKSLTYFPL